MLARPIDISQHLREHLYELRGLAEIAIHSCGQVCLLNMVQGVCRQGEAREVSTTCLLTSADGRRRFQPIRDLPR
jgi:hypothetical protein